MRFLRADRPVARGVAAAINTEKPFELLTYRCSRRCADTS
jgi:hypothetical protein